MLRVVTLVLCLLAASASAERRELRHEDGCRYDVYVPQRLDRSKKAPLLVLFHWSTARAPNMLKVWTDVADRYGIILAAPNSKHWLRWSEHDEEHVLQMLTDIEGRHPIDHERVYATGFSSGANFAYRMLASHPRLFRAVGPYAGQLLANDEELSSAPVPARVCIVHGTVDRRIPPRAASRAASRLRGFGYQVNQSWLPNGHWVPDSMAEPMWRCLDQVPSDRQS